MGWRKTWGILIKDPTHKIFFGGECLCVGKKKFAHVSFFVPFSIAAPFHFKLGFYLTSKSTSSYRVQSCTECLLKEAQ